jgi:opacity protein-like surface antigen
VRTRAGLAIALSLWPAFGAAQTIKAGTFELSGVTSVMSNRQTITTDDPSGQLPPGDVGFTSLALGFEGTYFISPRWGVGVLLSYQRLSVDAPDRNAFARLAGGYFGPFAQVRCPLGDRSSFVFAGSYGGIRTTIINQNTGIADNVSVNALGRYWLAGGGLSFALLSNASFDAGVRYQSSTFTVPGGQPGKTTAAGLLVGLGFSLYWR